MNQFVILTLAAFIAVAAAQRPSYAAGDNSGYPSLASRFQTEEDEAEVNLNNRVGETNPSTTTVRLPVDALGQADIVNRVSTWPKEQQPFWYLNHEIIEASRGRPVPAVPGTVQTQRPVLSNVGVAQRSSFLNKRSVRYVDLP